MIYGQSGTGKTTQVARMARFVFKKTKKITRLITADPGGWKTADPYINVGVIQPFSLLDERVIAPLEAISKLVQGYWPFDPETNQPLLRKVTADGPYKNREVFDFTHVKAKPTSETWKKVGGMGVEGLHSITFFIQDYLSGHPEILNELAGGVGSKQGAVSKIQEGSEVFVQPGKASYGFIQKMAYKLVRQSCDLPLEKVLWTSLEALYEKTDNEGNVIATEHYYPSMVGKAALRATPQWFGCLIHLDTVTLGVTDEHRPDKGRKVAAGTIIGTTNTEVRAYLKDHLSARDGNLFKAKPRVAFEVSSKMPASFKVTFDPPSDGSVHDLCSLYDLEDKLQQEATDKVRADLGIL